MPEPYDKTLQQLLKAAFDNTRIRDRLLPADDEETYFRFINYKTELNGCFCANVFGYEKGRFGQIIKESFDTDQIDTAALPAPKADDGTDQQFLDGKLYMVCSQNNLVLAQDIHLKANHLEHYLNVMFHERVNQLSGGRKLLLEPSISLKVRGQIKGVKRINLSAPLGLANRSPVAGLLDPDDRPGNIEEARRQSRLIPLGHTWEAIKAFLGDGIDLTQFETDGFIGPKDIKVALSLSWKRKGREQIYDQLDSLANTFRRIDDEVDIEVETDSGKIKHDELRLARQQSVTHRNDMPDTTDIFEKMIGWYEELVEAEHV